MKIPSLLASIKIGCMILLVQGLAAEAAEVRVLSASGMRAVINDLGPDFERATGHKLAIQYGTIGALRRQIEAGEAFDVAILTTRAIDVLGETGKIDNATRADIARSGYGVIVRAGAPKPNVGSADAFKRALLSASSISYLSGEGATATYLANLFERLGIAEQMKAKTKYGAGAGGPSQLVADGEAELGLVVISATRSVPGAEVLGPFPPELQNYRVYTGGVSTSSKQADAANALIKHLRAASAVPVIKAKGMEPANP